MLWTLLPCAAAYEVETLSDGEDMGTINLIVAGVLILGMAIASIALFRKRLSLGSIILTVNFLMYVRWLPLMDYQVSPFNFGFLKEFSKFFKYDDPIEIEEGAVEEVRFATYILPTSLFLNNAQQEILVSLCYVFLSLSAVPIASSLKSPGFFKLVFALGMFMSLDVFLFSVLEFSNLSSEVIQITSAGIAGLYFVGELVVLGLLIYRSIKKGYRLYLALFTEEFKEKYIYYYYTAFMIRNLAAGCVLVLLFDYKTVQFIALLLFEFALVLFVFIARPFKAFMDSILTGINHVIMSLLILFPLFYDEELIDSKVLNHSFLILFWLNLLNLTVRFTYDLTLSKKEPTGETPMIPQETDKVTPEPRINQTKDEALENKVKENDLFEKTKKEQVEQPDTGKAQRPGQSSPEPKPTNTRGRGRGRARGPRQGRAPPRNINDISVKRR